MALSPKMKGVLSAAKKGDVSHIQSPALKLAVNRGYLTADHKLTAEGFKALGGGYLIQVPKKADKGIVWITIGEQPSAAEAEAAARRLSVVNATRLRVVPDNGSVPNQFPVFDFGQKYTEDALTAVRVAEPGFVGAESEDFPTAMFFVQKRVAPAFVEGKQLEWELAIDQRFAAYEDAVQAAHQIANSDDKDGIECRIVYEDPFLPFVAYRNGQAGRPDTSIYAELIESTAGFFGSQGLPEAAGILLAEWAHSPEQVCQACAEALRRVGLHELAEVIGHV